jgi:hypothetical protein
MIMLIVILLLFQYGGRTIQPDEETCSSAGALCPGVSVSCAVCAIFLPSGCGPTCTVGALFCGTTLLQCQHGKYA